MNTTDSNPTGQRPLSEAQDVYDAQLSPLLDEALASPAAPAGLVDRIFDETRHRLPRARRMARRLALSIGPVWFRRVHAMAAGIVLAGTASLLLVASGILRDAHDTVTAKEDIAQLGQFASFEAPIDQDILQLAMRIDAASGAASEADALRTVEALETLLDASPNGQSQGIHKLF